MKKPIDFYRTPTVMDATNQNAFRYAARLLSGRFKRSSGEQVQITLSHQVAMEILQDNPELIKEILEDEFTHRPKLPSQKEFVDWLRSKTTARVLAKAIRCRDATVEHWFRYDKSFSYPNIGQWEKIKKFLGDVRFDNEMTYTETKEWY